MKEAIQGDQIWMTQEREAHTLDRAYTTPRLRNSISSRMRTNTEGRSRRSFVDGSEGWGQVEPPTNASQAVVPRGVKALLHKLCLWPTRNLTNRKTQTGRAMVHTRVFGDVEYVLSCYYSRVVSLHSVPPPSWEHLFSSRRRSSLDVLNARERRLHEAAEVLLAVDSEIQTGV